MLKLKQRNCQCGKPALLGRRICYLHWCEKKKELRLASVARKKARRAKKQAKLVNSYKYLHAKAWKLVSEYVRTAGHTKVYNTCFTCGVKKHWKNLQCGHLFHSRLDFYVERNLRPQCPRCNTYLSGNLAVYATKIAEELGVEGLKKLNLDANTTVYTTTDLKKLILKYQEALRALEDK